MTGQANWDAAKATASDFVAQWPADEPGGAIVAFDKGGIRFALSAGLANLSTKEPFTPQTVSRYASVTKHAFAALVLSRPDLIGIDDRLGSHLPELREPLSSVTVGQALDMTGGLPDARECFTLLGLSVYTETKAQPIHDYLTRVTRLNYETGTEVSYSNTGYRLVETALERKGVFFRDFIRARSASLAIELDAPDVWNDTVDGLAPGYWFDGSKWQLSAAGLHISASGSMTGSAEALAIWARSLMLGEGEQKGLLDALAAPRHLNDGRKTEYSLGIQHTQLGSRDLVGHGGSHPGYKSNFLIDRQTGMGVAVVSNREDTNAAGIALATLAALTGEPLPVTSTALPDGLYIASEGSLWAEVAGSTITCLDAGQTLYQDGEGWVSSLSGSLPMRLKADNGAIVGEIGHAGCRLEPAATTKLDSNLQGRWLSGEGASLEIDGSDVIMGIGPTRQRMALQGMGKGRYLFTLIDGPWTKRVCLHVLGEDRLELVLSRARMIEYGRDV